jgi:hypothetical protein
VSFLKAVVLCHYENMSVGDRNSLSTLVNQTNASEKRCLPLYKSWSSLEVVVETAPHVSVRLSKGFNHEVDSFEACNMKVSMMPCD